MLVPSLLLMAVSLLLFWRAPVNANYFVDILPSMLLIGVGAGIGFPALVSLGHGRCHA